MPSGQIILRQPGLGGGPLPDGVYLRWTRGGPAMYLARERAGQGRNIRGSREAAKGASWQGYAPAGDRAGRDRALAIALPASPARLQAAAALAGRFAADYDTWSWRQPPAAWLAGLRPMTTTRLYAALAQAAGIPGVLAQRDATRQAPAGTATTAQIPDLTPSPPTITV